jgi:hypothetical protein
MNVPEFCTVHTEFAIGFCPAHASLRSLSSTMRPCLALFYCEIEVQNKNSEAVQRSNLKFRMGVLGMKSSLTLLSISCLPVENVQQISLCFVLDTFFLNVFHVVVLI